MRLDPTTFSHHGSTLDLNKRANETFVANDATIEIDGLHDGDLFTERDVHYPDMLDLWFSHKLNPAAPGVTGACTRPRTETSSRSAVWESTLVTNTIQEVGYLGPKQFGKCVLHTLQDD